MNKSITSIMIIYLITLSGCATNGYQQYYKDLTGGRKVSEIYAIVPPDNYEPRVIKGTDPQAEIERMTEENYKMLGYSSFIGPLSSVNDPISVAKRVKAEVVITFTNHSHNESGVVPIVTPTTQTSYTTANASAYGSNGTWANAYGNATTTTYGSRTNYVSYNTSIYSQGAQFWIKAIPPIFGIKVIDLSNEKRREIASNKGVEISIVIKNSPAFDADLMKGDIIKKVDEIELSTAESFYKLLDQIKGQKVKIEGIRDGKPFKKIIQLNS